MVHRPNATPWTAQRVEVAGDICPTRSRSPGSPTRKGLPLRFPDVHGKTVSHDDARFRGKVVLVNITGTRCPNCNDEAPLPARAREALSRARPRDRESRLRAERRSRVGQRAVERFARHYGLSSRCSGRHQRPQSRGGDAARFHRPRVSDQHLRGPHRSRAQDPQRLRGTGHGPPRAAGRRADRLDRGAARNRLSPTRRPRGAARTASVR